MECPKCGGKEIFSPIVNRYVDLHGEVRHLKKYKCIKCGYNFDLNIDKLGFISHKQRR